MSDLELKARMCFEEAREFYKGASKSSNKIYLQGANKDKEENRHFAREEAEHIINVDGVRGYGYNPLQAGDILRMTADRIDRAGNCAEMSAVALSIIIENIPNTPVYFCVLPPPADHVFVIVGGKLEPGTTIRNLFINPRNSSGYVIDVWANVFCEAKDYHSEFVKKMRTWAGQHKAVIWINPGNGKRETRVPDSHYVDTISDSLIMTFRFDEWTI